MNDGRLKFLSLFAGILGGLDLGLERAGMRCVGQVELDPFCRRVLAKHWPGVWRHDDVRTLTGAMVHERSGAVDLVAGGFPCQDISVAGKGEGIDGLRSGLVWDLLRIVRAVRPRWLLLENVPALRTRGFDRVADELESTGYTVWPLVVGAEHVGAPHRRHRVFIVARLADAARHGQPKQPSHQRTNGKRTWPGGDETLADAPSRRQRADRIAQRNAGHADERGANLADAEQPRLGGHRADAGQPEVAEPGHGGACRWPARPGEPQHDWEEPRLMAYATGRAIGRGQQQPEGSAVAGDGRGGAVAQPQRPVGAAAHGIPGRLVRFANRNTLRAAGNAVVPAVAQFIGQRIMEVSNA